MCATYHGASLGNSHNLYTSVNTARVKTLGIDSWNAYIVSDEMRWKGYAVHMHFLWLFRLRDNQCFNLGKLVHLVDKPINCYYKC